MIKGILAGIIPFFLIISGECEKYGLDPVLVSAQVKAESAFDPEAISPAGAVGLMQVMPQTAKWLGFNPAVLLDPETNIKIGVYYDDWLFRYWRKRKYVGGALEFLAIASYNAGQGRVRRAIGDGLDIEKLPVETQGYVRKILGWRADYLWMVIRRIK